MTEPIESSDQVELIREQRLEGVVIRRCGACLAPGRFSTERDNFAAWPGILVEPGDLRDGDPVGDVCPNCGATRPPHEPQGTMWRRQWWGRIWVRESRE